MGTITWSKKSLYWHPLCINGMMLEDPTVASEIEVERCEKVCLIPNPQGLDDCQKCDITPGKWGINETGGDPLTFVTWNSGTIIESDWDNFVDNMFKDGFLSWDSPYVTLETGTDLRWTGATYVSDTYYVLGKIGAGIFCNSNPMSIGFDVLIVLSQTEDTYTPFASSPSNPDPSFFWTYTGTFQPYGGTPAFKQCGGCHDVTQNLYVPDTSAFGFVPAFTNATEFEMCAEF